MSSGMSSTEEIVSMIQHKIKTEDFLSGAKSVCAAFFTQKIWFKLFGCWILYISIN